MVDGCTSIDERDGGGDGEIHSCIISIHKITTTTTTTIRRRSKQASKQVENTSSQSVYISPLERWIAARSRAKSRECGADC